MAYQVLMQSQDITNFVDQMSIKIDDTLGQGSGAGSSPAPQGRATTAEFNTSLGPMNSAIGAGQPLGSYQNVTTTTKSTPSSDSFNRANASPGWGTASDGEAWSVIQGTANNLSIVSNQGQVSTVTNAQIATLGTVTYTDGETYAEFTPSATTDSFGLILRSNTSSNYYRLWFNGTTIVISKRVSGTFTSLTTYTVGAATAGQKYAMRFNATGTTLSGRFWLLASGEPTMWQATYVDSTFTSGIPGVMVALGATTDTVLVDNYAFNQYTTTVTNQWVPGNSGTPLLVRQGEIIITDATGNRVFGGYATKYTDITEKTQSFTNVAAIDYSTSLQRIIVNESFSAATDVYIIKFLIQKYAPWINLQYLPASAAYTFAVKNFRQMTLEQAIQTVAGITGFLFWVDYYKNLHYLSPSNASTAPFSISDTPDHISSWGAKIEEFLIDDTSAINRVTFYGGNYQSGDITQDVSPLANGNNLIFVFAYYPLPNSSGKVQVWVNGVLQTMGIANGNGGASDTFISKGGTAQCLIDTNGPNVQFDPASPPATGSTVVLGYRYNLPLVVQLADNNSYKFFGAPYLDGFINDTTVFDQPTAIQRCRILLLQQSFGLTTLKFITWKAGIQSGQIVKVKNGPRGINTSYLVQEVVTSPIGGGNFQFEVTCGAWNWNMVDVIVKLAANAMLPNQTSYSSTLTVMLEQAIENVKVHDVWTTRTANQGGYYARATPVGDGHDAYPGFFSITS